MPELEFQVTRPGLLSPDDIAKWSAFLRGTPALAAPFLSHAYAAAAERCFPHVRVLKFVQRDETVAFFPFQYRSAVHRIAGVGQAVGGDLSDYFGLIARPGFRISSEQLLQAAALKAVYFTQLEEAQIAFGLEAARAEAGVRVEFPLGAETFWSELRERDKKIVADTERRERNLVGAHGPLHFTFRTEDGGTELRRLIEVKRGQYARTGVGDPLASPAKRRFLAELAPLTGNDCCGTLSTLYAGEKWVGSHFGLMCGSTLHYWFPVYNPEMRTFSPGRLLLKAIMDAGEANGVRAIDRGAGDSQAKLDLATSYHRFWRGLWSRPGATSIGYRAAMSLRWRFRSWGARAETEASP